MSFLQTLTLRMVTTMSSLDIALWCPKTLLLLAPTPPLPSLSFMSEALSTSSIGLKTVPGWAKTSGMFCSGLRYTQPFDDDDAAALGDDELACGF